MNISLPLCRGRLITLDSNEVHWVSFKYERLPNLCYWCDCLTHPDKDCEWWIESEGTLKKRSMGRGLEQLHSWHPENLFSLSRPSTPVRKPKNLAKSKPKFIPNSGIPQPQRQANSHQLCRRKISSTSCLRKSRNMTWTSSRTVPKVSQLLTRISRGPLFWFPLLKPT